MYIYREQEYRETIRLLKLSIDENSKKSFLLPKETNDETIELEGGQILELQKEKTAEALDLDKRQNDGVYREPKIVKEIHAKLGNIV